MLNYSLSLKEFIQPIPFCQSDADFDRILDLVRQSNCDTIAISQIGGGWGTVNAADLLSLVAEIWLKDRAIEDSHTENLSARPSLNVRPILDFQSLIKPAVVCPSDLELNEFLNCWFRNSYLKTEVIYLAIDGQGELLGKLDRTQIIRYLASLVNRTHALESLPPQLSEIAKSLESISFPGQIITQAEESIYVNQQWHTLIGNTKVNLERQPILTTEANLDRAACCSAQQSSNRSNRTKVGATGCYLDLELIKGNSTSGEKASDFQHCTPTSNLATTVVSCQHDWHWLKIPLTISPNKNSNHESYFLLLATSIQSDQATRERSMSVPDVDRKILTAACHELKSPLTGMIGLSTLLAEQRLGKLNQRQMSYVELIHRSGKNMMKTVEDLIRLATLTSGTTELPLEPIDLEFLCRHLYQKVWLEVYSAADLGKTRIKYVPPELKIEPGCEIAIANQTCLTSALSHLMLEAFEVSKKLNRMAIEVRNLSGSIVIIIISHGIKQIDRQGFNLMMASHIAAAFGGRVTSHTSTDRRQFSLSLPKNAPKSLLQAETASSQATKASVTANLTILCLYPELEVVDPLLHQQDESNFDLKSCTDYDVAAGNRHRIIEADSLEQAHNLARIWHLDAIILNGYQIAEPSSYLQSLQKYERLASLPLITLDARTTQAANQIEGLNVYPCLLHTQNRHLDDLIQAIQIAIES